LDTVRFLAPEFNSLCIYTSEDYTLAVKKLLVCLVLGQLPLDSTVGMLLPSRKEYPWVTMTATLRERMENVNDSGVKAMTILESEQQESEGDHGSAPASTVNLGFPSTPSHKEDSGDRVFPSTPGHKEDSGDQGLSTPAAMGPHTPQVLQTPDATVRFIGASAAQPKASPSMVPEDVVQEWNMHVETICGNEDWFQKNFVFLFQGATAEDIKSKLPALLSKMEEMAQSFLQEKKMEDLMVSFKAFLQKDVMARYDSWVMAAAGVGSPMKVAT